MNANNSRYELVTAIPSSGPAWLVSGVAAYHHGPSAACLLAERFGTAQKMADDLRRFLEDKPIQAKRPSLAQRLRKWARRHRPVVRTGGVAGGVILVMTFAGLAVNRTIVTHQKNQTAAALLCPGKARARSAAERA